LVVDLNSAKADVNSVLSRHNPDSRRKIWQQTQFWMSYNKFVDTFKVLYCYWQRVVYKCYFKYLIM